jgi:hypothetical protein
MGAARGFALKFSDDDMFDIIKVVRPQTCSRGSCGVCCTLPTLEVQTPPGSTVGTIKERYTNALIRNLRYISNHLQKTTLIEVEFVI